MGLDVTAYRSLVPVTGAEVDEDGYPIDHERMWLFHADFVEWMNDYSPGLTEGLIGGTVYAHSESYAFRAGTNGGYEVWLDRLAEMAGYESPPESGAFAELMDILDNEGVIGPVVSAKLANDFLEWERDAERYAHSIGSNSFLALYRCWKKAFEMASDGGAVLLG